jgi:hypothetical protein
LTRYALLLGHRGSRRHIACTVKLGELNCPDLVHQTQIANAHRQHP